MGIPVKITAEANFASNYENEFMNMEGTYYLVPAEMIYSDRYILDETFSIDIKKIKEVTK